MIYIYTNILEDFMKITTPQLITKPSTKYLKAVKRLTFVSFHLLLSMMVKTK